MRRTFGVLDRADLDDLHVVSIKGGDPLIDLPESEVASGGQDLRAGDQRSTRDARRYTVHQGAPRPAARPRPTTLRTGSSSASPAAGGP